jgi:MFS family permease
MTTTSIVFVAAGLLIAFANVRLIEPVVGRLGVDGALRAGLALDAVGLLVLAGTETLPSLAAAIALLAIGQGLVTPSLAAAVAARVAPEHRGLALGNQQAAASLARVAGPALAGAAFGAVGPGAPFAAAAVLMLAAACITRTSGNRRKALPVAMTARTRRARATGSSGLPLPGYRLLDVSTQPAVGPARVEGHQFVDDKSLDVVGDAVGSNAHDRFGRFTPTGRDTVV